MPRERQTTGGGGMTVREAGRKGGNTVKQKYGPEFYSEIGKKGGEAVLQERGPEFFSEIGTKGGHKVRDLIEAGKRRMR